jgi:hypothetical protein
VRFDDRTPKGHLLEAIFHARIGAPSPPMELGDAWCLFVLRRVIPSRMKPLSAVRAVIAERLARMAHDRAVRDFETAYLRRWRAVTSCRAGFVVPRCSQHRTSGIEEDPLEL